MARVAGHLSVEALEARYEACADVIAAFSDDLAFGEGAFDRRCCRDDVVWPALD